jgi:DNA segregation ATPase FtsK/SpoIIIE-like protein
MQAGTLEMDWLNASADRIEQVLERMSVRARVDGGDIGLDRVSFHLIPLQSMTGERVVRAAPEIARAVGVDEVHVSSGEAGFTIDVPLRQEPSLRLLPMLAALDPLAPMTAVAGMSDRGRPLLLDLRNQETWHLWIEGPEASGKSEMLRTLLVSLAMANRPSHLKLLGIDPGGRELSVLEAFPHALARVATHARQARDLIVWLENEIERRLSRRISQPEIVLAVDDLAWMGGRFSRSLTGSFRRILSRARPAGVHVLAASRSVQAPHVRRSLAGGGLARAAAAVDSSAQAGWFTFRKADGRSMRVRIAWLSAADLQAAVDRVSMGASAGARQCSRVQVQ